MTHDDTTQRQEDVVQLLDRAYARFREGDLSQGIELLDQALAVDFENEEVVAGLKCGNFWRERMDRLDTLLNDFEKGEYLLSQWRNFLAFVERTGARFERCIYSFRQFLFGQALQYYERLLQGADTEDAEILFRVGRCYKGLGDYEHAIEQLETASQKRSDDPVILAELADCYALVNEVRASKAFFREAFFMNPRKIDVDALESEMIQRLVAKLREGGLESPQLEEWLPVYGVVYGVFTVKRELRPVEFGKLRQSIYELETQIEEHPEEQEAIPRLVNRYFWLIDHYVNTKDERSKVEDVLRRIQRLAPSIYELYTN
jgi:tetratricopeptide (TPR) repeat protein